MGILKNFSGMSHYIYSLLIYLWALLFADRLSLEKYELTILGLVAGVATISGINIVYFWKHKYGGFGFSPFMKLYAMFLLVRIGWLALAPLIESGPLHRVITELILFLLLINFLRENSSFKKIHTWENAIISTGIVLSLVDLALAMNLLRNWWGISGSFLVAPPIGIRVFGGLLGHPNLMSGYINLLTPIILVRLVNAGARQRKILWLGILSLFLIVQYFTSSRGGWIAGGAGLFVTIILLSRSNTLGKKASDKNALSMGRSSYLKIGLLGIALALGLYKLVSRAASAPGHGGRLEIWMNSLEVWRSNWILGNGTGAFPYHFSHIVEAPPGFISDHAHNILLQIGSENGILGLVIVLSMSYVIANIWLVSWRNSASSEGGNLAAYAGIGVSVIIHNMGDYLFGVPIYTTTVLLIASFLLFRDPRKYSSQLIRLKSIGLLVSLFLAIGVGLLIESRGLSKYKDGIVAGNNADWRTANDYLCAVADKHPTFSFSYFQCGLALANSIGSGETDHSLLIHSEDIFEKGLSIDPNWPPHFGNLAIVQWRNRDFPSAVASMEHAVDLAPGNSLFLINLGSMHEHLQNESYAMDSYEKALHLDPWLGEGIFFTKTELRKEIVIAHASHVNPESLESLYVNAYRAYRTGDLEVSENFLNESSRITTLDSTAYALRGLILEARGATEEAWKNSLTGVYIDANPRTLIWAAHVAISQGRNGSAVGLLEDAFRKLWTIRTQSKYYYAMVYIRYPLLRDLVDGYSRADVLPETRETLLWLTDYYRMRGETDNAKEISDWLNWTD